MSNDRSSWDGRASQEQTLPSYNVNVGPRWPSDEMASMEETVVGEPESYHSGLSEKGSAQRHRANTQVTIQTEHQPGEPLDNIKSPSQTREQASRLEDDLEMLKIEKQVSKDNSDETLSRTKSKENDSMYRSKSRRHVEHVDEFDAATNPLHEKTRIYKPIEHPMSGSGKFFKRIHRSNWVVRWFVYITPLTLILLIPLLLGALVFNNKKPTVGGVYLTWFMIWLEIVWLSLWLGRIIAKCLPFPIGLMSGLFTNNEKKWRDMAKQLELPATLFFWWLAIEISFLPTMTNHQRDQPHGHVATWMETTNKVLVSLFVGACLNFIEKIIIQLIAISFHLRTYADRIEINKFQIGSLTKLYQYSKEKIAMEDSEFELPSDEPSSGARTSGKLANDAAKTTKAAFSKLGDVAGKVAVDFTGFHQTMKSTHPHQVILALLHSTSGAQVLARRLYRTFANEETETVFAGDLQNAFDDTEEADAAFSMFDKDMNGDISMEELEAVCVEIGRERKSITASLKDLDSVVGKLDNVLLFIILVVTILVFISLISNSAAQFLTSAGTAVLALSWLLQASAEEFLQSVIFVFVKHPFDVGDRVSIYGNTGVDLKGDDYFVKEISLLYTEFKKMEGSSVQAPNSYLNTLFILNHRRSGGVAEAVSISIKFGTTLDQIDGLRMKLLEFVRDEKREYQEKILTELRDIVEAHSMSMNVVFFYKSNWQNEGLRLSRRNKFICALMVSMQELGIEGPRMRYPGQKQSFPVYLQNVPHVKVPGSGHSGHPDQPGGMVHVLPEEHQDPPFVSPIPGQEDTTGSIPQYSGLRNGSILKGSRTRGESLSAMSRRIDFSLGTKQFAASDMAGDVYESTSRQRVPVEVTEASRSRGLEVEALRRSLEKNAKQSQDIGRSTSRDGRLLPGHPTRRSTDGTSRWQSGPTHRNRFFGRSRRETDDEQGLMETGMVDIPELPSTAGSGGARQDYNNEHLGPRSGTVGLRAWQEDADESSIRPSLPVHQPVDRIQTEDFEMKSLH